MTNQQSPEVLRDISGGIQEISMVQATRIRDCAVLSQAFGIAAEPYYQDPDSGPEQEIISYQLPILGCGIIIEFSNANKALTSHLRSLVFPQQEGFSESSNYTLLGFKLKPSEPHLPERHLASTFLIATPLARNDSFLEMVRSVKYQEGLKMFREAPKNQEVAKIISDTYNKVIRGEMSFEEYQAMLIPHLGQSVFTLS